VSPPPADNAIRHSKQAGIIENITSNQRNVVYIAPNVVTALDRFAERAHRC